MPELAPQNSDSGIRVPVRLVSQVRDIVQDFRAVNELFEGEELSDIQIAKFIVDTVDDWNYSPPVINPLITPTNLLSVTTNGAIRVAVVNGSAIRCLRVLIMRHAKNDMPFTGGNITVQAHAVWANLMKIADEMKAEYETNKQRIKVGLNIKGAYTMAPSELDSYYGLGFNDGAFILV